MNRTRVAVILVAGIGSRLRPLTDDRPKALVDIGGETILGRAVRLLAEYGVERIVLATGYREDAVRAALAESALEIAYCPNPRYDSTQNSISLALCKSAVGEDAFFKLDGDVVFRKDVLERLDSRSDALSVALDRTRRTDAEAMKVRVDDGMRILELGKHIALDAAAGESIGIERIGASFVSPLFRALDAAEGRGRLDLYYEDVYSELIQRGELQAHAVDVGDLPWTEVDTFEDLQKARELFQTSFVP
jgi:choline kinase